MGADFRLGIQSYCFRNFLPLNELVDALNKVSLRYVEIWPKHIPYTGSKEEQQKALDTLKENNITMDSYGQVVFSADEKAARQAMEFSKLAGIKAVTAHVEPDGIQAAEKLTEEFGISLAIHNHGRKHIYGTFAQLDELFSKTSERFGLCLDTAWFLDAGEEPLEALEKYKGRIFGVHLKDFTFDDQGNHEDVIIGTGGLKLPEFIRRLNDADYNGYLSLEYEGNPDDPFDDVIECSKQLQEAVNEL